MNISRNKQHFIIMTVIYDELNDFEYGEVKTPREASSLIAELCGCPYEEVPKYIIDTVNISLSKYGIIKKEFLPKLNSWTWERIPVLTRSILIMSYTHYYFVEKIDKRIVIDIAVELSKTYLDEKQTKFINAILDEVLK